MKGTVTKRANAPARYTGYDSMPIAGQWRKGRSGRRIEDVDPYRGDILVSIRVRLF